MRKASPPTPPLQQPALGPSPTDVSEPQPPPSTSAPTKSTSKPRHPQPARTKKPTTPASLPSPTLTSSSLSSVQPDLSLSVQPDLSLSVQRTAVKQARRRPLNKFACFAYQKKKTRVAISYQSLTRRSTRLTSPFYEYAVREGAVSRYADLKVTFEQLERENSDFKDLLAYLRFRPEKEAFEIYRRLRASDNPLAVLQYFREAETLLIAPSTAGSGMADRHAADIDAEALAQSDLKVPARPWTPVAGDGLVSSLITAFFNNMRRGVLGAHYYTPLLVNAICVLRSLLSDRAKNLSRVTNIDLGALFFAEAKKQMGCLDARKPENSEQRVTLSKTCWGLFFIKRRVPEPECSLMSGAYFKPLAPPPNIRHYKVKTYYWGRRRYEDALSQGFAEYSPMFFICIWNVAPTLVPLLGEAYAQNLFTRGCALMHVVERDLPLVRLAMPIPRDARPYLEGLTQHKRDPKDLSVSFIVPTQDELLES
ncbi:hypothetical protein B0T26DRAFT_676756 [Lasiosphaeria miniovina]|uniref:Uncharacterized protein n=1 Tax=Lasiosphaeria miniovina TaxID=1954250 RepID=A0AA40AMK3_9PEZI|nr:uncharacterized protein B0T26DRAFT_676756 [Lasiosphaeria miniovina]KAK0718616.1 hypothetical protein B0T26DRAFT_676756 [Lasiosphaeria miniovina]